MSVVVYQGHEWANLYGWKITLSQPQVASESEIRNFIKIGVSLQQFKG